MANFMLLGNLYAFNDSFVNLLYEYLLGNGICLGTPNQVKILHYLPCPFQERMSLLDVCQY